MSICLVGACIYVGKEVRDRYRQTEISEDGDSEIVRDRDREEERERKREREREGDALKRSGEM